MRALMLLFHFLGFLGIIPMERVFCFEDDPNRGGGPNRSRQSSGDINEEIRTVLETVQESVRGQADFEASLDEIRTAASRRDADVVALRGELDTLQQRAEERENTITELQRRTREQGIARDGLATRSRALEIFGMGLRAELSRHTGASIPRQFQGEDQVLRDYRATLSADASPGTLMIPTMLEREIVDGLEELPDLLNRANFIPGLPGNVDLTVATGRPTLQAKRATIDTAMTQSDPGFAQMSLRPDEAYIFTPVDNRLLQMGAHALGAYMLPLLRDSVMGGLARWLVEADGTSTYNDIVGILAETNPAYIFTLAGETFESMTAKELVNLKAKALKRSRARGAWLMHETVLFSIIGELVRTGKVPVVTFTPNGEPLVYGSPVVLDESMPTEADSADDTAFIGFGDLAAYTVGLQGGIQLAASEHLMFNKNQTCFRALVNTDIKRVPAALFVTGKSKESAG